VLPAFSEPRPLEVNETLSDARPSYELDDHALAMFLVYREPWVREWTVVAGAAIESSAAFDHCLTWADFQREVEGGELEARMLDGVRGSLRASGLSVTGFTQPNLMRRLLPAGAVVLRALRRLD
jgi:hypothetical protein